MQYQAAARKICKWNDWLAEDYIREKYWKKGRKGVNDAGDRCEAGDKWSTTILISRSGHGPRVIDSLGRWASYQICSVPC